jgi:hypothetical protein
LVEREGIEPLVATPLNMTTGLQPAMGNTLRILKHTIIYDATLDSESSRFKYVLEYPLLLEDMIGLIPYPVICTSVLSPHVHPTVRPFKTFLSVSSGPRYLAI